MCENILHTIDLRSVTSIGSNVAGTAADSVFAAEFLAAGVVVFADHVISSADFKRSPFDEINGQFFAGVGIQALHRGTRYMHLLGALLLGETDIVDQPDRLVFFEGKGHYLHVVLIIGVFCIKVIIFWKAANPLAFFWSCHKLSSFHVDSALCECSITALIYIISLFSGRGTGKTDFYQKIFLKVVINRFTQVRICVIISIVHEFMKLNGFLRQAEKAVYQNICR